MTISDDESPTPTSSIEDTGAQSMGAADNNRECEGLKTTLDMARRALNHLEQKVAGYGSLETPTSLQIQVQDKREEVARLQVRMEECEQ